jgi:hypothetical protein
LLPIFLKVRAVKVVISYRRDDSQAIAGRIREHIERRYGPRFVYIDVRNIPIGVAHKQHFRNALRRADLMMVIIGRRWLGVKDDGQRRIDEEDDFVRSEVEAALDLTVPIIPVLVDGGLMPEVKQLPESLAELPALNAAVVDSGRDFDHHMERLFEELDKRIGSSEFKPEPDPALKPIAKSSRRKIGCTVQIVLLSLPLFVVGGILTNELTLFRTVDRREQQLQQERREQEPISAEAARQSELARQRAEEYARLARQSAEQEQQRAQRAEEARKSAEQRRQQPQEKATAFPCSDTTTAEKVFASDPIPTHTSFRNSRSDEIYIARYDRFGGPAFSFLLRPNEERTVSSTGNQLWAAWMTDEPHGCIKAYWPTHEYNRADVE